MPRKRKFGDQSIMHIAIATDSRGYMPKKRKYDHWVKSLTIELESVGHRVDSEFGWRGAVYLKSGIIRLTTVFSVFKELRKKNKKFNILICQLGLHDWVIPWNAITWKLMIPQNRFDKKAFKQDKFFLDPEVRYSGKVGFYQDKALIGEYLKKLRIYADYLIVVGMHSWANLSFPLKESSRGHLHHRILEMNSIYADTCVDLYIDMPMNSSWSITERSAEGDYTHYNKIGHSMVHSILNTVIQCHMKIIPNFLNQFTKQININGTKLSGKDFVKRAYNYGQFIASHTLEKDIVLIAKKSFVEQMTYFLGAIVYNRIPVIFPISCSIKDVKKILNISLCICDENNYEEFNNFFITKHNLSNGVDKKNKKTICEMTDTAYIQLKHENCSLKAIKVSHRDLINHVFLFRQAMGITDNDCIVSCAPLYNSVGLVMGFLLPIICNANFVYVHSFESERLIKSIQECGGTYVWMPDYAFSCLLQVDDKKIHENCFRTLKWCVNYSNRININDMYEFQKKFVKFGLSRDAVKTFYSIEENICAVSEPSSFRIVETKGRNGISCGRVFAGTSVVIVKNNKDVTEQETGIIHVKSMYMPAQKLNSFYGYYNTRDQGFIEKGELFLLDPGV